MDLYEFEAKKIFEQYGIPVLDGVVITKEDDINGLLTTISLPAVLKSQVLTGGRGVAGGIKFAETKEEAAEKIRELFDLTIKKYAVDTILIEKKANIRKEVYVSITMDKEHSCPVFIVSPEGGVDIEKVAEKTPEKILKVRVDIFKGLAGYELRKIAKKLDVGPEIFSILKKMYSIFMECDANLVEINPLAITEEGLLAVDAKMTIDNKASYRQEIFSRVERKKDQIQKLIKKYGLSTYVELDGNIGVVSGGAGTGMLTLDLIQDLGGKAANFAELGGITDAETIKNAMKAVSSNQNVKVLLATMIGGLDRMDEMAEGIIAFFDEHGPMPVVIRMSGTLEDVGRKMLQEKGFEATGDPYEAVQKAVKLSKEC